MKKKLIFITEALWIGGIETALVNLLNRLDYDRYEVTCLILRDSQELAGRLPPQCRLLVADRQHAVSFPETYQYKRLYNLMEEPQHTSRLRRLIWQLLCLVLRGPEARRYAAYVRQQLNGEHFDTAVIYSDRTAETAVRAISADKFLMFYHHGAMRREYHDELGYRRAEKVIVVSESLAEKLKAYRPRYAEKIIAINNLIDIEGVRRKSLEAPKIVFRKDQFNIVSCGRLSPAKGMDLAVEACGLLVQRGLKDVHWWIVGGGPEEERLRQQITRLGLGAYITLLGMQENPYPYIRQADMYVQPSRFEAYGLTIAEAKVLGVPVLSTETDGGKELIINGIDGLLCQPDAPSIANGAERLHRDSAFRQRFQQTQAEHDFEEDNASILQRLDTLF